MHRGELFERLIGRRPTSRERELLAEQRRAARAHFWRSPTDAAALAAVDPDGDRPRAVTLAAWTVLASTLLNLDEFLSQE